jgi:DNA-binding winged helix-turn-helix (wHTH) protein/WD40 repeat protein
LKYLSVGAFRLDLRAGELSRKGYAVRLQEQPFLILRMLVERPGEVVLREEIRKRLWPNDTLVDFDHSVNAAVNKLREALGDSARSPKYIETVARRGYRLIAPVAPVEVADPAPAQPEPPPPPEGSTDLTGKLVSHYRVAEQLGAGGMGVVYKAEDLKLGRAVALKFPSPELWSDAEHRARLEREARAGAALDHPNICTVYEVGEHEGKPYIAMQLLRGETLSRRIDAGPVPVDEIVRVGVQIAAGLEAAHRAGLVHGDVKPANLFLTESGEVKILDFGLVSQSGEAQLTGARAYGGTAVYMSPEQIQGERVDARSDLYSLGLVLYEMATGRSAADGVDASAVPAPLRSLIAQVTDADRARRFASAAELRAALERTQPAAPTGRKVAAASVLVLLAAGAILWFRNPAGIEERSLTSNALEDAVDTAAISPDGTLLAFARAGSLWLQNVRTGAARVLTHEASAGIASISWSPDGARLYFAAPRGGIFTVRTSGSDGPLRLRERGEAAAVSLDGATVAFLDDDGRSLSLMNADGSAAREVYHVRPDFRLAVPAWTASGILVFAQVGHGAENCGGWISSWNPATRQSADILQVNGCVRGLATLPGERVVYLLRSYTDGELHELRLGSGDTPRRIADHTGTVDTLSAPLRGGVLVYRKTTGVVSVYAADLEAGVRLANPRRVSSAENNSNYVHGWTDDSRSVLFESIYQGQFRLFRKPIDGGGPDVPLPGSEAGVGPKLSPDGKWILFNRPVALASGGPGSRYQLMRLPAAGGQAELVADEPDPFNFHCARAPATQCVLLSAGDRMLRFRAFDPVRGAGAELASVDERPADWDLSPQGDRLSLVRASGSKIRVLSLPPTTGEREVEVAGWDRLHTVNWSADGKGWFVCADRPGENALLWVGENGEVVSLRVFGSGCSWAVPSPDGRHLAFSELHQAANVRMLPAR